MSERSVHKSTFGACKRSSTKKSSAASKRPLPQNKFLSTYFSFDSKAICPPGPLCKLQNSPTLKPTTSWRSSKRKHLSWSSHDDLDILDLLKDYHIAEKGCSAYACKSPVMPTNIHYSHETETDAERNTTISEGNHLHEQLVNDQLLPHNKLRNTLMSHRVSLASYDIDYLRQLMLDHFESPFEDEDQGLKPEAKLGDDMNRNVVIELIHPKQFGSSKTKLYEILKSSSGNTMRRQHSRARRNESFWKSIAFL